MRNAPCRCGRVMTWRTREHMGLASMRTTMTACDREWLDWLTTDTSLIPPGLDQCGDHMTARVRTSFTPVRAEADLIVAAHMNPLM
jgi:hypothetical protein